MTESITFKDESYKIMGACFEVYNQRGFGFTEPIYQECLQVEFALQGIPFLSQPQIRLDYKGTKLKGFFQPDFVCYGKIIVELKAVSALTDAHISQTLNYLNATNFELALLVNFGRFPKLDYKRVTNERKRSLKDEINSWLET